MDVFLVRFEQIYDAAILTVVAEDDVEARDLAEAWLSEHHERLFSLGGFAVDVTRLSTANKGVLHGEIIGYD